MAEHKKSPHDSKRSAGWTTSVNLGTRLLVFDDGEAIQLLKAAVESEGTQEAFAKRHRAGSQGAFADRHGIHRTYVSMILSGRSHVTLDHKGFRSSQGLRRARFAPG